MPNKKSKVNKDSKPGPRTAQEIADQIIALNNIKPRVRARTMFGDDNHAAIDAQIEVLRLNMREKAIWDRYFFDEEGDPDEQREAGKSESIFDSAMDARRWLDGENEEGLADAWKPALR